LPLWMMGYPEQALQRTRRALSLADERHHLSTSAMALNHAAGCHNLRREPQITLQLMQAGLALSNEHGFSLWKALHTIELGKALAESGQQAEGIAHMEEGLKAARERETDAHTFGALAQAYGKIGQSAKSLELIEDALATDTNAGRYSTVPELHRIRGELLLMRDPPSLAEAEQCFRTAISKAQRRAAKSWELRATTSLARLLTKQGRRDEARTMLAEIYGWFTEGFDTADLQEAKALLNELSG